MGWWCFRCRAEFNYSSILVVAIVSFFFGAIPASSQEWSGSIILKLKSDTQLRRQLSRGGFSLRSVSSRAARNVAIEMGEHYGIGVPEYFLYPRNASLMDASVATKESQEKDRFIRFTPPPSSDLDHLVNSISRDPRVLYAEKETIFRAIGLPDDPLLNQQYSHAITQAHLAWDVHTGERSTTIAIVDTGVELNHPDLKASLVPGSSFVSGSSPNDQDGHGTHCAGIAAASGNNGEGITGVSWGARIMPVQVLDSSGMGSSGQVAAGIRYAAEQGASVISLSLGSSSRSQVIEDAVNFARSKDAVVIAAAGNDGTSDLHYPSACPGVVAVGATDSLDQRTPWSNYGDWVTLFAPGRSLLSTYLGGSFRKLSGTSMATPYVAGAAALLRSLRPELREYEVRWALQQATDDISDQNLGQITRVLQGRLNVARLLGVLPRANARFAVVGLTEAIGNQDGQFTSGEEISIRVGVRNLSSSPLNVRISAASESPDIEVLRSEVEVGSVAAGSVFYTGTDKSITVRIRNNARKTGDSAPISLQLLTDLGELQRISATIPLGLSQIAGFPISITQARSAGSVLVDDLDSDGQREVVFSLNGILGNYLWIVDNQGKPLPSWPKILPGGSYQGPIGHHVAIGNISGDDKKEIIAGFRGQYSFVTSAPVYAYSVSGAALPGFPRKLGAAGYSPSRKESVSHGSTTPTLADIDGNGLLDVVIGEGMLTDATDVVGPSRIFAIAGDGSDLPGFPLEVEDRISPGHPLIVDDLNGDGAAEFSAITGFNSVQAWNNRGVSLIRQMVRQGGAILQPPLGLLSVRPFGTQRSLSTFSSGGVTLMSLGDKPNRGFPSVAGLPRAPDTWAPQGDAQTPLWGDFDRDGFFEAVYATSASIHYEDVVLINAVDGYGDVKPGFPIQLRALPSSKLVGQMTAMDFDGDGSSEFILPFAHGIEIRSPFGNKRFSTSIAYPPKCYLSGSLTPTIADINNNGLPEVIFACQSESYTLKLNALELSGATVSTGGAWPMYQQDGARSGRVSESGAIPPTATPSSTPTATATSTPTSTATASASATPSPSATATSTSRPTASATPTMTPLSSLSPTVTPTNSPSAILPTPSNTLIQTSSPSPNPSTLPALTPTTRGDGTRSPAPSPTAEPLPPNSTLTPGGSASTPANPEAGALMSLSLKQTKALRLGRARFQVNAMDFGAPTLAAVSSSTRLWVSITCALKKRRVLQHLGVRFPGSSQIWMRQLSKSMRCQAAGEYFGRRILSPVSRLR